MADLPALRGLVDWMRANGVEHLRVDDVELRLGPPPPAAIEVPDAPPDPDGERRRQLETLLYSSGADVTPFLKRAG